jgi:hypothetical protein
MKARVTIEYDLTQWDQASLGLQGLRQRKEQRWITSETFLGLPRSATVKVELTPDSD